MITTRGVSMIVEDLKDVNGLWYKYITSGVARNVTSSYSRWAGMTQRCKTGGSVQKLQPTYIGCIMSENFKDFQYFANWHTKQVGYNVKGYQLDKDILTAGNKVYSEDTCVLVPQELNKFLTARANDRGSLPQGVCFYVRDALYRAQLSVNGIRKLLGTYDTLGAACTAYKKAKEAEAYRWYERLKVGEFVVDGRVTERMRTWTLDEQEYSNYN